MSLGNEHKDRLVTMFLRGRSVTDLSAFYAVTRTAVEDVIREAIQQLATLATAHVRHDTKEQADNREHGL